MTTNPTTLNRLRARTLRWLLKLATAHDLPLPKTIQFGTIECCGETLRYLSLGLDDDIDVGAWPTAIDADSIEEFEVTGDTHRWTCVDVSTTWRMDSPRLDWHHIRVIVRHDVQPLADTRAVTA